ncbi:MAG: 4-(cytidine 5'-diphospho)-2-C-methyl-D-erythritol kinase, partial [Armatimonadota bacterium]|nr:4-(cytidine 5'-diphospho)-2-C-methyl-D-erythritol kinase [Armatimonadota bacterium]
VEVTSSTEDAPDGPENLAFQAAQRLRQTAGVERGARIHIRKNIPSQAGLGGGSADAAAALVGLNKLWNLDLQPEALEGMGRELGADVPFCVRGGAAYAEGVGEVLTPLHPLSPAWLVIIKPETPVSTAAAYRMLDAAVRTPGPLPGVALDIIRRNDSEHLPSIFYNDFEQVVLPAYTEIQHAHAILRERTRDALLCGSGSAIFSIVESEHRALELQDQLLSEGWQTYAAALAPVSSQITHG